MSRDVVPEISGPPLNFYVRGEISTHSESSSSSKTNEENREHIKTEENTRVVLW